VSVPLAPSGLGLFLGQGVGYSDDYSGTRDFRATDEAVFDQAMAPLIDGSNTNAAIGVTIFPGGGGAFRPTAYSTSVVGAEITMARQIVTSLSLMPDGNGGTDYDVTATWELWGCLP
jgi:hypothetical protein